MSYYEQPLRLLPERRSGRGTGLGPATEAQLRAMQAAVDLIGDQIDIALRDGEPGALAPAFPLLQQLTVQAAELHAMLRGEAGR